MGDWIVADAAYRVATLLVVMAVAVRASMATDSPMRTFSSSTTSQVGFFAVCSAMALVKTRRQ